MSGKTEPTIPILTTERLLLRQLLETDTPELFLLRSDKTINQYLGRKPAETTADALQFIQNILKNKQLYWAITSAQNKQLIGTICLFDFSEDGSTCETGFELLTEQRGKGFMQEAAKSIIAFAAETLAVKTINAYTHQQNRASMKLLQHLGFVQTAFADEGSGELLLFRLSVSQEIG